MCEGYFYASQGGDSPTGNAKSFKDSVKAHSKSASVIGRNSSGGINIISGNYFDDLRNSNQTSFFASTSEIRADCNATVSAILIEHDEPFTINGKTPKLANIALGDGASACDGHEIIPLEQANLKGCVFGTDIDKYQIAMDVDGTVVDIQRKLLVDYRSMDWQKFVKSAQTYGPAPVFNLRHWIVGYGDNFELIGPDTKPTVAWKDSGRGFLFHGVPCPNASCGFDGTNVEVTITLRDSDRLNLAILGRTVTDTRESTVKENLALIAVRKAELAANEKRRIQDEALAVAEENRKQEEAAKITWRQISTISDDGHFLINKKVPKIQNIALGDGYDVCPTKIVRDSFSAANTGYVGKFLNWTADVCYFGDSSDQTTVFYGTDGKVVKVQRIVGFDVSQYDGSAFLDSAKNRYGDGGYETATILAYGTSFEVDPFKEVDTGFGLIIQIRPCVVTSCIGKNRDDEVLITLTDKDAFTRLHENGRNSVREEKIKSANEFKF